MEDDLIHRLRNWTAATDKVGRHCMLDAIAEIERLRAELADYKNACEGSAADLRARDATIAALTARIEGAPVAIMDTRHALGLCAPTEEDFPALYALQGKRVALVVIDDA